jgi:hypothetical protein
VKLSRAEFDARGRARCGHPAAAPPIIAMNSRRSFANLVGPGDEYIRQGNAE